MSKSSRSELVERLALGVRQSIASAILFNQKVADDVGINLRDLQVLHLLQLHGPSTPRDLTRWACVTSGGMTVILDRLEKDHYVRREANPADRRSCVVHLIPDAMKGIEGAYTAKGKLLAAVIEPYKNKELRLLIGFFEQMNS